MKEVFKLIEEKKQVFAKLPFFEYLQDENIEPFQRLNWILCFAQFAMTFGELNRSILREEPTDDPIQKIVNQYTHEDDYHWYWMLDDIEKLGIDSQLKFTDTLRFLWGEKTVKTRRLSYDTFALSLFNTEPILRLAIIESIEATANVGLPIVAKVATELQRMTHMEYKYLGRGHILAEEDHLIHTSEVRQIIENLQINEEEEAKALEIVDQVFSLFSQCMDELMQYSKHNHQEKILKTNSIKNLAISVGKL
jgi:hypothetical protein